MSRFQHTLGPWQVGDIDPAGARRVEADGGQSVICYVAPWEDPGEDEDDPQMEANAQLIAAAPDLYAAAKACLSDSGGSTLRATRVGPPNPTAPRYHVNPERMQGLARAVAKAAKSRPGPLETLAQVHHEANLLSAMEQLLENVHGDGTYGGEFRIDSATFIRAKLAFTKWKDTIR